MGWESKRKDSKYSREDLWVGGLTIKESFQPIRIKSRASSLSGMVCLRLMKRLLSIG